ncbi:erythrocyte band 7 integral membrane protein [Eurytemora carolleeae]|uniref:erythrocyte band 7 integral membrane protein n=1 Tax=Eurytemora carolleeae TaxID=1294199 RepID=UPI000C764A71|nr:erythrocyte band 7 integral membrane protein [Eurytemora carolleeae]|eukprot:XP_023345538.1 erythrocyte band 7 integral membrane protein-like [Eurytemora affinis]
MYDLQVSQWSSSSRSRLVATFLLHALSYLLVAITVPFSLFFVLKRVREFERAVILGSTLEKACERGPGLIFVLPGLEKCQIVDTRTKVFEVPPQQILSTDSVTLTVDAVIYYRVFDPVRAAISSIDYNQAVRSLASSTMGSILGTYRLSSLLSDREEIAGQILNTFRSACDPWGIAVQRVEIKSLVVAKEMVKSMAIEAQAEREANGLLILQEGEANCLQQIRKAADEMNQAPTSLVLKYLQVLSNVSSQKNSTYIVPLPKEFFQSQENYVHQYENYAPPPAPVHRVHHINPTPVHPAPAYTPTVHSAPAHTPPVYPAPAYTPPVQDIIKDPDYDEIITDHSEMIILK